jgi:hypothetical protein
MTDLQMLISTARGSRVPLRVATAPVSQISRLHIVPVYRKRAMSGRLLTRASVLSRPGGAVLPVDTKLCVLSFKDKA